MNVMAGIGDDRVIAARVAGWTFIGGALLSIPSSMLMRPTPAPSFVLLTALGVVTGLICLRVPWQRLPPWALQLIPAVGTIEAAIVVGLVDELYGFFFPLIIVFVALVSHNRRDVLPHFLLIGVALFLPVAYEPAEETRECLYQALFLFPVVATAGGMAIYLRDQLERNTRGVEQLAVEASATAARIRRTLAARPPARWPTDPASLPADTPTARSD